MSKTNDNSKVVVNSGSTFGRGQGDMHMPDLTSIGDNGLELMTESEVIIFLRIPEISNSKDYHNVIEHLKKYRGLPRIHICRKALYPKRAILKWMEKETDVGN
jgi:hypothetical protein